MGKQENADLKVGATRRQFRRSRKLKLDRGGQILGKEALGIARQLQELGLRIDERVGGNRASKDLVRGAIAEEVREFPSHHDNQVGVTIGGPFPLRERAKKQDLDNLRMRGLRPPHGLPQIAKDLIIVKESDFGTTPGFVLHTRSVPGCPSH